MNSNRHTFPLLLCAVIACCLAGQAHSQQRQAQMQMNLMQSVGCTFSNQQSGSLGLSQDWRTLSTETSEGRRPSVRVLNTGQVTLSNTQNFGVWLRDSAPFSMTNSTVALRDQPTLGNAINLPLVLNTPGYRDLYLEATGTSSSGTLPSGVYKIGITLNCM